MSGLQAIQMSPVKTHGTLQPTYCGVPLLTSDRKAFVSGIRFDTWTNKRHYKTFTVIVSRRTFVTSLLLFVLYRPITRTRVRAGTCHVSAVTLLDVGAGSANLRSALKANETHSQNKKAQLCFIIAGALSLCDSATGCMGKVRHSG